MTGAKQVKAFQYRHRAVRSTSELRPEPTVRVTIIVSYFDFLERARTSSNHTNTQRILEEQLRLRGKAIRPCGRRCKGGSIGPREDDAPEAWPAFFQMTWSHLPATTQQ